MVRSTAAPRRGRLSVYDGHSPHGEEGRLSVPGLRARCPSEGMFQPWLLTSPWSSNTWHLRPVVSVKLDGSRFVSPGPCKEVRERSAASVACRPVRCTSTPGCPSSETLRACGPAGPFTPSEGFIHLLTVVHGATRGPQLVLELWSVLVRSLAPSKDLEASAGLVFRQPLMFRDSFLAETSASFYFPVAFSPQICSHSDSGPPLNGPLRVLERLQEFQVPSRHGDRSHYQEVETPVSRWSSIITEASTQQHVTPSSSSQPSFCCNQLKTLL
ncbi:hypothetical protein D4764_01G0000800 [Takifugu flavidus]|uniref:Uncharacterized protein n=1 Tax=Takifugu flavidus TaxID=433684 RepID=A0A5C6PLD4_9TELE|nr:hypothetical protein D4764_01G0000800 [Takifugu flavidus]